MIQVLNVIEQLQLVPDKLEARISEKRFLTAVDILQDALRMIRKSEMENIGALSDLRIYLSNQEHSLTDILIEELHNHLYLKSPYCEDRWKEYAQNQAKGDLSERAQTDVRGRLLYHFLDSLDTSEPVSLLICCVTHMQLMYIRWWMIHSETPRQTLSHTSNLSLNLSTK
jgi:exocyst complex component 4